jgi:hypothetical protein
VANCIKVYLEFSTVGYLKVSKLCLPKNIKAKRNPFLDMFIHINTIVEIAIGFITVTCTGTQARLQ